MQHQRAPSPSKMHALGSNIASFCCRLNPSENGCNQYDAGAGKIEAGWFTNLTGASEKKESPLAGFEIVNIHDGDALGFPQVHNLKQRANVTFLAASLSGGRIEVHRGAPNGQLPGTCAVASTGSFARYSQFMCSLADTTDPIDLFLVFRGTGSDAMHSDSFSFTK